MGRERYVVPMLDTQLILVEGMTGAGKSTTAKRLDQRLAAHGCEARSFHEFDADNPIRTKSSEAMKKGYEKDGPLPIPDAGPPGANPFGSQQWAELASALVTTPGRVVILESRYWQNSLFSRWLNGWDVEKLRSYQRRMCEHAAPARPALVALHYDDPAAVMERVFPERKPEWRRWMQGMVSDSAWCRERGLEGSEAVLRVYEAWTPIADALFADHRPHKVRLHDPAADWEAAMCELDRFLEIDS